MSGYLGRIRHSDYLVAVRIKLWTCEIGVVEKSWRGKGNIYLYYVYIYVHLGDIGDKAPLKAKESSEIQRKKDVKS